MSRSVFLTGASSGIGEALASHYAAPGVTLGLLARRETTLRMVAERCRARGAAVFVYPVDITDGAAVRAAAESFLAEASGAVDLVIANAGISRRDDEAGGDREIPREVMETNFFGVLHTLTPFIRPMEAAGGGSLVAVSSVAASRGLPNAGAYSASKAAVNIWMESLRVRLMGRVHVMTVCPGFIMTPMTAANSFRMPWLMSPERAAAWIARGVERRTAVLVFPVPMRWLVRLLRLLPPAVYDAIMRWGRRHYPDAFRRTSPRGPLSDASP